VRLGNVGLERYRAGEDIGRVGPAELMGDDAEPVQRRKMVGVDGADLPLQPLGLGQAAGLMMRRRLREVLIGRWRETVTHYAG